VSPTPCAADIVAAGAVWPGPLPVTRPAPAGVAEGAWPAYRVDAATEASLLPPGRIKRMGRGQMMAIGAVARALADGATSPARGGATAVSVGTAWSEEGDEVVFLEHLIRLGDKGAKPAYFVNSVKNALAAQLAIHFGYQGENQTFAHDALSFETALWQGAHLVATGRVRHAVVCGVDALVELEEMRGHLLGRYATQATPLQPLASVSRTAGQGTLPGEGAAAFVLAAPGAAAASLARLALVRVRGPGQRPPALSSVGELDFIAQSLRDTPVRLEEVDLLLLGANGDPALDAVYAEVASGLHARAPRLAIAVYRHLTGDFATASALGFELAVRAVAGKVTPSQARVVLGTPGPLARVLLYHVTNAGYHSVALVTT
jgi:3-oxoacyl-[acyl-carrier-protein] synthase II